MSKKFFVGLMSAVLLTGCFGSPVSPPQPAAPKHAKIKPVPTETTVVGKGWTVTLPPEFKVTGTPDKPMIIPGAKQVVTAIAGEGEQTVIFLMSEVALDSGDASAEDFGVAAVATIIQDEQIRLIDAKKVEIQGHPATVAFYVLPKGILIAQVAVGIDRTGYVLQCGGQEKSKERIADLCKKALPTFKLVP